MSNKPRGPQVPDGDHLYRVITTSDWWKAATDTPSSAAFKHPSFSADIASKSSPKKTLDRFDIGSGLVSFNCGDARVIGFDSREEPDPEFPKNLAHANVYNDAGSSERKRRARKLAEACRLVVRPSF